MKPGQLVMLIKRYNDNSVPPYVGAVGEIVRCGDAVSSAVLGKCYYVHFEGAPSPYGPDWLCIHSQIIPINDPDIEIEGCDEAPVDEKLLESVE